MPSVACTLFTTALFLAVLGAHASADAFVADFQNPGGFVEMMWRDTANAQAN